MLLLLDLCLEKLYGYFYTCWGDLMCLFNAPIPYWELTLK